MKRLAVIFAIGFAAALTLGASTAAAQEPDGAALYREHCRRCHGARGTPSQRMADLYPKIKSLADSAVMAHVTTDSVVAVVNKGRGDMKPLADKLTAEEIQAVARYVLTLKNGGGS